VPAVRKISVPVAAVALALVSGCGAAPGTDAVTEVADAWLAAARANDAATLCRLLTPSAAQSTETGGNSCEQTVGDLDLPGDGRAGKVEVWSDRAQVKAGSETLFLTKVSGGWRVSGAGCRFQGDQPYDCEVEG
jgi:hypothetical protein